MLASSPSSTRKFSSATTCSCDRKPVTQVVSSGGPFPIPDCHVIITGRYHAVTLLRYCVAISSPVNDLRAYGPKIPNHSRLPTSDQRLPVSSALHSPHILRFRHSSSATGGSPSLASHCPSLLEISMLSLIRSGLSQWEARNVPSWSLRNANELQVRRRFGPRFLFPACYVT